MDVRNRVPGEGGRSIGPCRLIQEEYSMNILDVRRMEKVKILWYTNIIRVGLLGPIKRVVS